MTLREILTSIAGKLAARATWVAAGRALAIVALAAAIGALVGGVGTVLLKQRSAYQPPPVHQVGQAQFTADIGASGAALAVSDPLYRDSRSGVLLVDAIHRNAFREHEIAPLLSLAAQLGYDVEFVGNYGNVEKEADRIAPLQEKLRRADAFLVVLPRTDYGDAEAAVVESFVAKGGRLLLLADPTRAHSINTLAERFGLSFQPDYLYNLAENNRSFRHIYVREFQPEELTAGLDTVALYTAGSIRTSGVALAFTDANTQSSLSESDGGRLSPMAWGSHRNVLAIADLTFIIPPHDQQADNPRLLANLADFLTAGDRGFDLADFPHFYAANPADGPSGGVNVLTGRPELLDVAATLRSGLAGYGVHASVAAAEDVSRDTVFIGLYEDARQVQPYLANAGVRVDDTLGAPFAAEVPLAGTSLTLLDAGPGRHVLIILADTPEGVSGAVGSLLAGDFRQNLVGNFVAFNQPPAKNKPAESKAEAK